MYTHTYDINSYHIIRLRPRPGPEQGAAVGWADHPDQRLMYMYACVYIYIYVYLSLSIYIRILYLSLSLSLYIYIYIVVM